MKKINFITIFMIASIILQLIFAVKTIIDFIGYSPEFTSFPFYAIVLLNAFYFLLPAIILLSIVLIIKIKRK